jgi:hypothetical protein
VADLGANLSRQRALVLVAALAVTAWGAAGLYEGLNSGFSGGLYDPEYRVPGVYPGGLADRSGFKSGDRVISVEGLPVETLGMESRWPRSLVPRISESRRFVVQRDGEQVPIDVVFPAPFAAAVANRVRAALVGLAFMGAGLWALLTVHTRHALTLAHIGLAAGVSAALGLGPHLGWWNGVQGHLATAANVLMFILLLRFFVTFPVPKAVSRSSTAAWLVYGAWACLLAFLLVEVVVHPALYYSTGSVTSLLILVYVLLILAAITHTVVTGPRAEVRASGMPWILGGLLAAIVWTASRFASAVNLPAWTDAAATAAIPLSMALAVRKHATLERTQVAARSRSS